MANTYAAQQTLSACDLHLHATHPILPKGLASTGGYPKQTVMPVHITQLCLGRQLNILMHGLPHTYQYGCTPERWLQGKRPCHCQPTCSHLHGVDAVHFKTGNDSSLPKKAVMARKFCQFAAEGKGLDHHGCSLHSAVICTSVPADRPHADMLRGREYLPSLSSRAAATMSSKVLCLRCFLPCKGRDMHIDVSVGVYVVT